MFDHPSELSAIPRGSLEEQAYRAIRSAIVNGVLRGGARLVQEELAARLSVSRVPVRDAIKRLTADGLVDKDVKGGYYVRKLDEEDVVEIYRLRELLEPYALEVAGASLADHHFEQLRSLLDSMREAAAEGDAESFIELNSRFHFLVYEASGMPRLVRVIRSLWSGMPPLTPMGVAGQIERSASEHARLVIALQDGDVGHAVSVLRDHISRSGRDLLHHLATRSERGSGKPSD